MQLKQFQDVQAFHHHTQAYLLQHEAEHNLLLGIVHNLLHHPNRNSQPPYLVSVEEAGNLVAVAIQTPPYKLVLSKVTNLAALELIIQDAQRRLLFLPGVSGLVAEAQAFVKAWQTLTDQPAELAMQMRIHQLTEVQPLPSVNGILRPATEADRPLLIDWFQAFIAEAIASLGGDAEQMVDAALKKQSLYLWEDAVPVSFAGTTVALPTLARIGPVYTPPAFRRQGYATALVAALSQQLLNQGCDRCYLFTDLTNPTSNHIYQTIGYCPVCDWEEYAFPSLMS